LATLDTDTQDGKFHVSDQLPLHLLCDGRKGRSICLPQRTVSRGLDRLHDGAHWTGMYFVDCCCNAGAGKDLPANKIIALLAVSHAYPFSSLHHFLFPWGEGEPSLVRLSVQLSSSLSPAQCTVDLYPVVGYCV